MWRTYTVEFELFSYQEKMKLRYLKENYGSGKCIKLGDPKSERQKPRVPSHVWMDPSL